MTEIHPVNNKTKNYTKETKLLKCKQKLQNKAVLFGRNFLVKIPQAIDNHDTICDQDIYFSVYLKTNYWGMCNDINDSSKFIST